MFQLRCSLLQRIYDDLQAPRRHAVNIAGASTPKNCRLSRHPSLRLPQVLAPEHKFCERNVAIESCLPSPCPLRQTVRHHTRERWKCIRAFALNCGDFWPIWVAQHSFVSCTLQVSAVIGHYDIYFLCHTFSKQIKRPYTSDRIVTV